MFWLGKREIESCPFWEPFLHEPIWWVGAVWWNHFVEENILFSHGGSGIPASLIEQQSASKTHFRITLFPLQSVQQGS